MSHRKHKHKKRKPAFDNEAVTKLATKYAKNPTKKVRNQILETIMPLINAAMVRRNVPKENREDVKQECVIKLLETAIPAFNPKRGKAFAFFWTAICNSIITHNRRWTSTSVSLTAGETESTDTEILGADVFQTPENQFVLNRIATEIGKAFDKEGFSIPNERRHRKSLVLIRKSIQSGEFFNDRSKIMRRLRRIGLKSKEVKHCIDYTLIKVRQKLLGARGDLDVLIVTPSERSVSKVVSS